MFNNIYTSKICCYILLTDERDGAVMSHKESQQLLQTERDRIVELERSLATHQAQLAATMGSKDQVNANVNLHSQNIEFILYGPI